MSYTGLKVIYVGEVYQTANGTQYLVSGSKHSRGNEPRIVGLVCTKYPVSGEYRSEGYFESNRIMKTGYDSELGRPFGVVDSDFSAVYRKVDDLWNKS